MNAQIASVLDYSKGAARRLARARRLPLRRDSLRAGYHAISVLGAASIEKRRVAALIGSAALAAGSVYVVRRASLTYADVLSDDHPYRVSTLAELRNDDEALALVQRELQAEWGPFAPADMDEMRRMARNAGRLVYVVRFYEDGKLALPSGVLQTAMVDAGGEPERLTVAYPSFEAVLGSPPWSHPASIEGDTAVLLQITAFGDRSHGVGSRLRDTALYMLPPSVKWALTTTPVPAGFDLRGDPESLPAARFHFRGGARPAAYAPGFKTPSPERAALPAGRQSAQDVVFMRYRRLENGDWEGVARPEMRLRHHPMDVRLSRVVREWRPHKPARQAAAA